MPAKKLCAVDSFWEKRKKIIFLALHKSTTLQCKPHAQKELGEGKEDDKILYKFSRDNSKTFKNHMHS